MAAELLRRIAEEGAYANLVVPAALDASELPERDRRLVTELVYGATRRRRAIDWLVDRHVAFEPDPTARSLLRVGAYQLAYLDIPPYAAVSATVAAAPVKIRPFVNAVLRKLVNEKRPEWPNDVVRLSYPDWIVDRLTADLGADRAISALEAMNAAPLVTAREDGYVQDLASQWVAETLPARAGDSVLDLCAGPGGKATAIAARGAHVIAADIRLHRAELVAENAVRVGLADRIAVVVTDGTDPPVKPGRIFDSALVDVPCSGLGALRRRPDARWRIGEDDVERLAVLQRRLIERALSMVRPGGMLLYSACTLTASETTGIDDWLAREHPAWEQAAMMPAWSSPGDEARGSPGDRSGEGRAADASPWETLGRGFIVLPQTAGTDGMYLLALRCPGAVTSQRPERLPG